LVDDFIIGYCKVLNKRDFAYETEKHSNKKGKRQYLKDDFTNKLNEYFLSKVNIPRIKVVSQQEIETLINEEAQLFAKYLTELPCSSCGTKNKINASFCKQCGIPFSLNNKATR
jgi:hypothetical protein